MIRLQTSDQDFADHEIMSVKGIRLGEHCVWSSGLSSKRGELPVAEVQLAVNPATCERDSN
jgi:hypothetical protein